VKQRRDAELARKFETVGVRLLIVLLGTMYVFVATGYIEHQQRNKSEVTLR